ncbi:MAG: redoxin family protein, partial [Pirellulales bacterium]|nr:redoxin family protein [Pirellulales bacterium]
IVTLVQVRDGWRVVDLPHGFSPDQELTLGAEIFFPPAMQPVSLPTATTPAGISDAGQELLAQLNTIDEELETASRTSDRTSLHVKRADILGKLSQQSVPSEEKQAWVRQLADTVSAAVQTGELPSGVERLEDLVKQLTREQQPDALIAYVRFRHLSADYAQKINEPDADFGAIQQQWLANLKQFVTSFPKSEDAAEAMLQLAIAREFENLETEASTWYARIIKQYPDTIAARKAAGARRRLRSVGQKIALRGTTLSGKKIDLASLRGKVVVVHYWATWCEPCLEQMEQLRTLQTRYGRKRFQIVGVNLDTNAQDVKAYLQNRRFQWSHLFEKGGLDSRLANELGILSLPTMLLIGADGKVLTRNLHIEAAEAQVKAALQ